MGHTWNRNFRLASIVARELKAARNLTKLRKLQPSSIRQILAASGLMDSSVGAPHLSRLMSTEEAYQKWHKATAK